MSASIPPAPTLNVGDLCNYQGQTYSITNVSAPSDNGNGVITYSLTLSNGKVVTGTFSQMVLSAKLNNGQATWSRSPGN